MGEAREVESRFSNKKYYNRKTKNKRIENLCRSESQSGESSISASEAAEQKSLGFRHSERSESAEAKRFPSRIARAGKAIP